MMLIRFDINAQVAWRAARDSKTNAWVAICDPLKLTARGDTWSQLVAMIDEIQNDLFLEHMREGSLEEFLRDHGWSLVSQIPAKTTEERVYFDIPTSVQPDRYASA